MNSMDGRIKANAAVVAGGTSEAIVYASDTTDVILDINGYSFLCRARTRWQLLPLTPCRVVDTHGAEVTRRSCPARKPGA